MAISIEHPLTTPPYRTAELPAAISLQELIDNGTLYVARDLTVSQLATLQAIAGRIVGPRHPERLDAQVDTMFAHGIANMPTLAPVAVNYQLGLDELDTIARTRTGYAFAELPTEIQDAILGLITTRDLTSRELDLALWLHQLYVMATAN